MQPSSQSWPIDTKDSFVRLGKTSTCDASGVRLLLMFIVPSCVACTMCPFGSVAVGPFFRHFIFDKNRKWSFRKKCFIAPESNFIVSLVLFIFEVSLLVKLEATGDFVFTLFNICFIIFIILNFMSVAPVSPNLHSRLGRQSLLLPPLWSLKVAVSWWPVFLLGHFFPQWSQHPQDQQYRLFGFPVLGFTVHDGVVWFYDSLSTFSVSCLIRFNKAVVVLSYFVKLFTPKVLSWPWLLSSDSS